MLRWSGWVDVDHCYSDYTLQGITLNACPWCIPGTFVCWSFRVFIVTVGLRFASRQLCRGQRPAPIVARHPRRGQRPASAVTREESPSLKSLRMPFAVQQLSCIILLASVVFTLCPLMPFWSQGIGRARPAASFFPHPPTPCTEGLPYGSHVWVPDTCMCTGTDRFGHFVKWRAGGSSL